MKEQHDGLNLMKDLKKRLDSLKQREQKQWTCLRRVREGQKAKERELESGPFKGVDLQKLKSYQEKHFSTKNREKEQIFNKLRTEIKRVETKLQKEEAKLKKKSKKEEKKSKKKKSKKEEEAKLLESQTGSSSTTTPFNPYANVIHESPFGAWGRCVAFLRPIGSLERIMDIAGGQEPEVSNYDVLLVDHVVQVCGILYYYYHAGNYVDCYC
jgi:hypothetical protein